MKPFRLGAALAACALLVSSGVAQQPHAPVPPTPVPAPQNVDPDGARIFSPKPTYDFGDAPQNDKVEYEFELENRGKKPLEISRVNPTCSCTVAEPAKKRLEPGEKTTVKATFNTQTFNGPVTKTLVVDSNDQTQPRFNLTISGRVSQAFRPSATEVNFGTLRKGTKFPEQQFDVLTAATMSSTLLDVQSDHPNVKAKFDRLPANSPAKGYRVTVTLEGQPPVGSLRGALTVITDLTSQKQFTVPFVAQIDGEVAMTPKQFSFAGLKAGETPSKEIRITKTGDAPLNIKSMTMKTGGLFKAELVEVKAGREYVVKVTPKADIKTGYQRETLTITTDVPGEEALSVYFYAVVGAPAK